MLCEFFEMALSCYCCLKQLTPNTCRRNDAVNPKQIAAFHRANRGVLGVQRLVVDLKEEAGIRTSKRLCARIMREQSLRGRKKHSRR